MHPNPIKLAAILAPVILAATGCDEDENGRLAEMAERHLQRQAEQERQMVELHQEVAAGASRLVEADARAREEMVALHAQVQVEQAEVGRQRDLLEQERRDLAAKRRLDPIVAEAIAQVGLLVACLLPLALCWYLLHPRVEPADDQLVAEVLLEDLVIDRPLLLPSAQTNRGIGFAPDGEASRPADEPAAGSDPA